MTCSTVAFIFCNGLNNTRAIKIEKIIRIKRSKSPTPNETHATFFTGAITSLSSISAIIPHFNPSIANGAKELTTGIER